MSPTDEEREGLVNRSSDRALWRRSCLTDAPEDEASRFLDLAAFADGLLEPDDHDRVAALLACDPVAANDVAAAGVIDRGVQEPPGRVERVIARACAASPEATDARVIAFPPLPARRRICATLARFCGRDICVGGRARHHAAPSDMGGVNPIPGTQFVLRCRGVVDPHSGSCPAGKPCRAASADRVGACSRSDTEAGLAAIHRESSYAYATDA